MEADNTKPKRLMRMLFGEQGDVLLEPVTLSMTISSGLLMLGNIVISPLLVDLAGIYQVSPAQIGLIITLYNAPPVILMLFMGVLADRIGRKILLFWGLMVYALWGLIAVVSASGMMLETDAFWGSDAVEEVHEVAANLLLLLAALHVGGVALESRLSGVNLVRAMWDGVKRLPDGRP